ncbi:MAG: glycoside hydrolase family 1 protein [Clostridia bacterium]|nr:glycoside hydrolase family 1 protein [Clostridia bacterium]
MSFKLKEGLLLGTATAGAQIEGGDTNSNWARFSAEGKIADGTSILRATGHWERWREDCELMARMGMQIYRLGIEWSRIEPKRGEFSEEALKRYREEILYLGELGIKPLVTLHHFTHPLWFEDLGGFTSKEAPDLFMRYVERVIDAIGDVAAEYITINEPNVYATNSLFYGQWPPEKRSMGALVRAFTNMTACHVRAYEYIHDRRREMGYDDTKVGFANHLRIFEPKNKKNPWHRLCARLSEWLFQGAITEAMMSGSCRFPVGRAKGVRKGKYYDFIGINYYSRSTVSGIADGVREGCFKNDLGWEIYHEGLIELARRLGDKYGAPVYVTENGTCDNTDAFRPLFIYEQLKAISESDNPIERYYHWSFVDNFEWKEGESARFGIVHVDYESGERTVKASGRLYSEIIRSGGVSEEVYRELVEPCKYHY